MHGKVLLLSSLKQQKLRHLPSKPTNPFEYIERLFLSIIKETEEGPDMTKEEGDEEEGIADDLNSCGFSATEMVLTFHFISFDER